jgi:hypothetical protein
MEDYHLDLLLAEPIQNSIQLSGPSNDSSSRSLSGGALDANARRHMNESFAAAPSLGQPSVKGNHSIEGCFFGRSTEEERVVCLGIFVLWLLLFCWSDNFTILMVWKYDSIC